MCRIVGVDSFPNETIVIEEWGDADVRHVMGPGMGMVRTTVGH